MFLYFLGICKYISPAFLAASKNIVGQANVMKSGRNCALECLATGYHRYIRIHLSVRFPVCLYRKSNLILCFENRFEINLIGFRLYWAKV